MGCIQGSSLVVQRPFCEIVYLASRNQLSLVVVDWMIVSFPFSRAAFTTC